MNNPAAIALVIRSLPMLEDVYALYENEIAPIFCEKISEIVGEWAKNKDFVGKYDLWEDELYFNLKGWESENEGSKEVSARYALIIQDKGKEVDCEAEYYLSPFLGIGSGRAGIKFFINYRLLSAKPSSFKKYVQNHESYRELSKNGFLPLNDGSWFYPISLDSENLANAYQAGTLEDAMQPLFNVLDKIEQAHPLFEKLLADAEKHDFSKQG